MPAAATAVTLNITVVQPTRAGYLTVRASDARGEASTSAMNFEADDTAFNSSTVALSSSGAVRFLYEAFGVSTGELQLLVDMLGSYVPVPAGAAGPAGPVGPAGPSGVGMVELSVCGPNGDQPCKVGMTEPAGGFIFYVDSMDQHPGFDYLEAAPTDAADGALVSVPRCSNTSTALGLSDCDERALGAGATNSAFMLSGGPRCTSGAAKLAGGYAVTVGTSVYDDWYLPSITELTLMFHNLGQSGVGALSIAEYWSSTESGSSLALSQNFQTGTVGSSGKAGGRRRRSRRAVDPRLSTDLVLLASRDPTARSGSSGDRT